jgi:hypothetical protein
MTFASSNVAANSSQIGAMSETYFNPESNADITDAELHRSDPATQKEVMRWWFRQNFEDPSESMPYDSEDGFIWIWGGPYEAPWELQAEFDGVVDDSVIAELGSELEGECFEWAPGPHHPDLIDAFVDVLASSVPSRTFRSRMSGIEELLAASYPAHLVQAQLQLLLSAAVAALEAYLAERAVRGVRRHPEVLTRFIEQYPMFREHKIPVSEVPKMASGLEAYAANLLSRMIWQRLEEARRVFKAAFDVEDFPEVHGLNETIKLRHDIVHRAGVASDGIPVTLDVESLRARLQAVRAFVDELEPQLPIDDDTDLQIVYADGYPDF